MNRNLPCQVCGAAILLFFPFLSPFLQAVSRALCYSTHCFPCKKGWTHASCYSVIKSCMLVMLRIVLDSCILWLMNSQAKCSSILSKHVENEINSFASFAFHFVATRRNRSRQMAQRGPGIEACAICSTTHTLPARHGPCNGGGDLPSDSEKFYTSTRGSFTLICPLALMKFKGHLQFNDTCQ